MAITIPIITDFNARGLKDAETKIDKFAKSAGRGLKNLGKAAAIGAAAFGAGIAVFGKKAIEAGEAAATSNARIAQINESMGLFGDSTKAVTDRLIKYAEATARSTGVDQNQIKLTQAKLLTFNKLARSAGKLGGSFDRATKAAVDMASAGFGSAENNAVQLGKALNDPIKGVTALTKSGITFTAQEKEKIKTLVESNRMLEAQELVLKAIETQVGGTAEATANDTDKMKVAFSQVSERVGIALLPILSKLTSFLIDTLIPAAEKVIKIFNKEGLGGVLRRLGDFISDAIPPALTALGNFLQSGRLVDRQHRSATTFRKNRSPQRSPHQLDQRVRAPSLKQPRRVHGRHDQMDLERRHPSTYQSDRQTFYRSSQMARGHWPITHQRHRLIHWATRSQPCRVARRSIINTRVS
jgi:hypothetical protein